MALVLALAAMPACVFAQATTPPECAGLPASDWIDVQQGSFENWSGGGTVADSTASDGYAAYMPGDATPWSIQYPVPASQAGTWHCYAHARIDTMSTSGLAFSVGICDSAAGGVVQVNIALEDGASDGLYQMCDLGVQNLTSSMYFWFAIDDSAAQGLYVDRIVLAPTTAVECIGLPTSDWIDIEQGSFNNWSGGGTVVDPLASDDYAAYMPGNATGWTLQCPVSASQAGTWHCYAHVRVEATATSGFAFAVGVYNASPGNQVNAMLENGAGDGLYHVYDLGIQQLTSSSYFWFATPDNLSAVQGLYVDRVVLVGTSTPVECVGLPSNQWIDVQQSAFTLYGCSSVTDYSASDGYAAKMPGNTSSWLVQYPIPASQDGTWHCYAHVRVDTTATSGLAFVVATANASPGARDNVMLENGASDGQYHVYDLGVQQLTPGAYFWFSTVNNPSVQAVYVDRIVLVGIATPPECVGLPSNEWIDVQQGAFTLYGCSSVTDYSASDGYAAEMPGNTANWLVQYPVPASQDGTWHCYAHVRVDTTATSGLAFAVGILATQDNVLLQNGASDGQYHAYDLGVQQLTPGAYFWFSTVDNPSVSAVYVDRIVLRSVVTANSLPGLSGLPDNREIQLDSAAVVTTSQGAFTDGSAFIEEPNRELRHPMCL